MNRIGSTFTLSTLDMVKKLVPELQPMVERGWSKDSFSLLALCVSLPALF
jgi:hypothetical protein